MADKIAMTTPRETGKTGVANTIKPVIWEPENCMILMVWNLGREMEKHYIVEWITPDGKKARARRESLIDAFGAFGDDDLPLSIREFVSVAVWENSMTEEEIESQIRERRREGKAYAVS
jgi:hypothetical protein